MIVKCKRVVTDQGVLDSTTVCTYAHVMLCELLSLTMEGTYARGHCGPARHLALLSSVQMLVLVPCLTFASFTMAQNSLSFRSCGLGKLQNRPNFDHLTLCRVRRMDFLIDSTSECWAERCVEQPWSKDFLDSWFEFFRKIQNLTTRKKIFSTSDSRGGHSHTGGGMMLTF